MNHQFTLYNDMLGQVREGEFMKRGGEVWGSSLCALKNVHIYDTGLEGWVTGW